MIGLCVQVEIKEFANYMLIWRVLLGTSSKLISGVDNSISCGHKNEVLFFTTAG